MIYDEFWSGKKIKQANSKHNAIFYSIYEYLESKKFQSINIYIRSIIFTKSSSIFIEFLRIELLSNRTICKYFYYFSVFTTQSLDAWIWPEFGSSFVLNTF